MSVAPNDSAQVAAERFQPQIRIGAARRAHGGARVSIVEGDAVSASGAQWQPLTRSVEESELAAAGLFEERVFDVAERGEELVIAKALHVREELRVSKSVTRHVEQVDETLRHNEVEVEDLAPLGAGADDARESSGAGLREDAPAH